MPKHAALSLDELLKPKTLDVPVDSGCVTIKALTGAYAVGLRGRSLGDDAIFELLSVSLLEPQATPEQVGKFDMATIQVILDAVMEFNSLSAGKAEQDLKKTQASASHTP